MVKRSVFSLTLLFILVTIRTATAAPITASSSIPDPSTLVDFSQFTGPLTETSGPVQVGDLVGVDIEWSSTSSSSLIGDGDYDLGTNGSWSRQFVGSNSDTAVMRFEFNDGSLGAVGGLINYDPGLNEDVVMTVFDSSGAILESFNVTSTAPISTPDGLNDGGFRGFLRLANDIAAFEVTGSRVALDDLTFAVLAEPPVIPEPSTAVLMFCGALGICGWRRRTGKTA